MPGEEAQEVRALLRFEENTAGGMMKNSQFGFRRETALRDEVWSGSGRRTSPGAT